MPITYIDIPEDRIIKYALSLPEPYSDVTTGKSLYSFRINIGTSLTPDAVDLLSYNLETMIATDNITVKIRSDSVSLCYQGEEITSWIIPSSEDSDNDDLTRVVNELSTVMPSPKAPTNPERFLLADDDVVQTPNLSDDETEATLVELLVDSDGYMQRIKNHVDSPLAAEVMELVEFKGWLIFGNAKPDLVKALEPFGATFQNYLFGFNHSI